jgi:hypothetical protein
MCIAIGNGRGEKLQIAPTPGAGDRPEIQSIFDEPVCGADDSESNEPIRL